VSYTFKIQRTQKCTKEILVYHLNRKFKEWTKDHILLYKITCSWGNRSSILINDKTILPGYFWTPWKVNYSFLLNIHAFILSKVRNWLVSLLAQDPQGKSSEELYKVYIDYYSVRVGHLLPFILNYICEAFTHKTYENQFLHSLAW
jgi:hypothetical protein